MRKALMITFALIIISSTASAGGWLHLFADDSHLMDCYIISTHFPWICMDVYLFATPPEAGFVSTTCKIVLPDTAMLISGVDYHPYIYIVFGDWSSGMNLVYDSCMTDPWVLCATIHIVLVPPGLQPGCQVIELAPEDDTGFFGFTPCNFENPFEEAQHGYDVYVNCPGTYYCVIANEGSSWSAIKRMYR